MKNKYAIIVSACDKNSWVWPYWYRYWDVYTAGTNIHKYFDVIFLCETKYPAFVGRGIDFVTAGENVPWTQRVKQFCETCDYKYVLYTVEDQMLMERPQVNFIDSLRAVMEAEKMRYISLFADKYMRFQVKHGKSIDYGLIECTPNYRQVFTLQCALFETAFLRWLMRPPETIWQAEINGHARIRNAGIKTHLYPGPYNPWPFREVLKVGKVKPHRAKFLWAIDACDFPSGDDKHLDKHTTGWYYNKWRDKISSRCLPENLTRWVEE